MKKTFLFVLFLFIQFNALLAVNSDSLVTFKDLIFKSKDEYNAFYNCNHPLTYSELVSLFILPDDSINYSIIESRLIEFTTPLSSKIASKSEQEKVSIIKENVAAIFLKKYLPNTPFTALFETGTYNSVSSMALFSLVFSKLKIPYQLVEDSNKIYLKVYPQTANISLQGNFNEHTSFEYSEHYKIKFAKEIYISQKISKQEFETHTTDQVFNKHYHIKKLISVKELAGIHYHNFALTNTDNRKLPEAYLYAQKAYFLHSTESHKYLLKYTLFNVLGSNNYADISDVKKLALLCRYFNSGDLEVNDAFIKSEYARLINTALTQKINDETFNNYHTIILNNIKDSSLLADIDFTYHFELARQGISSWTTHSIKFDHLELAYARKPLDKNLQGLIIESFNLTMQQLKSEEKVLALIDDYGKKFEFVKTNTPIVSVQIDCYLLVAYKYFNAKKLNEGNVILDKCATLCKKLSITPNPEYAEAAYLEAARNYYLAGNKTKAKAYLLEGLALVPQSIKIQDKLNLMK